MFVRMAIGRDRGEVRDIRFEEAQAMLKNGRAVKVDFDESDAMGKKDIARPADPVPSERSTGSLIAGRTVRRFGKKRRRA
jgi:hypothetical protein